MRWFAYPSVQIAICIALFVGLGYKFGPFGLVLTAPLLAAAIARPLLNFFGNVHDEVRARVWLPVHGEHFVFKDVTIHVVEDDAHCRWVSLAAARKVAGITVSDGALQQALGDRMQREGRQVWVRDDALVDYLSRSTSDVALRFRTWLDRQVVFPGAKIRERLGVKLDEEEKDE